MKKNPAFEHWIADHMIDGMIIMEPYGYRENEPGVFLHIFRICLQFADEPEPFEGVAFIPIPFAGGVKSVHDYTFDEQSLDFLDDFIYYD